MDHLTLLLLFYALLATAIFQVHTLNILICMHMSKIQVGKEQVINTCYKGGAWNKLSHMISGSHLISYCLIEYPALHVYIVTLIFEINIACMSCIIILKWVVYKIFSVLMFEFLKKCLKFEFVQNINHVYHSRW